MLGERHERQFGLWILSDKWDSFSVHLLASTLGKV
jgi:hypothetical protein